MNIIKLIFFYFVFTLFLYRAQAPDFGYDFVCFTLSSLKKMECTSNTAWGENSHMYNEAFVMSHFHLLQQ